MRKSRNFRPKIRNRECVTHLFWTNCQFLCAIIYSNTNSLKFFCENSSLNLANFTERVTFCVNSWKFYPSPKILSLVPLVINSMSDTWLRWWSDTVFPTHIENFSAQPCPFLSTLCRRFARWTETSTYSVTFDTSTLLTSLDTTLSGKGSSEVPSITIMGQLGSKAFWCFILHVPDICQYCCDLCDSYQLCHFATLTQGLTSTRAKLQGTRIGKRFLKYSKQKYIYLS